MIMLLWSICWGVLEFGTIGHCGTTSINLQINLTLWNTDITHTIRFVETFTFHGNDTICQWQIVSLPWTLESNYTSSIAQWEESAFNTQFWLIKGCIYWSDNMLWPSGHCRLERCLVHDFCGQHNLQIKALNKGNTYLSIMKPAYIQGVIRLNLNISITLQVSSFPVHSHI